MSFCFYDTNYVNSDSTEQYQHYINEQYSTARLTSILKEVCAIIGANVLNIAEQEYQPQGASVTMLIAEAEDAVADEFSQSAKPGPYPESVVAHLDKSHICVHTYPETHPVDGIHTFRADIEVATCGVISPLKALNYLIHSFNSDVITLDYRVRGFTRDIEGKKHYIDHKIDSIQNFLSLDSQEKYQAVDVNLYQENLFHTKLLKQDFQLDDYVIGTDINQWQESQKTQVSQELQQELQEIFNARNLSI